LSLRNTLRAPIVALLALITIVAGLTACGGGSDVNGLLKQTFSGNQKVKSGKLSVTLSLDAQGLQGVNGPVKLVLTGPFQSRGAKQLPLFDLQLALNAAGQSLSAGAVSTGDKGFLKFQGTAYALTDQIFAQFKQSFETSQAQQGTKKNQSFGAFGINPRDWLSDAKNAGSENVGGADTTHIKAKVDLAKLLVDVDKLLAKAGQAGGSATQRLPTRLTEAQRKQVRDALKNVTFDLYTGKADKTLRRMTIGFDFSVPQGRQAAANGLKGGHVDLDLTITDLNKPQTIVAPANPRPLTELQQQISQLTSALRGQTSGTTGTTGTTTGATAGTTTGATAGTTTGSTTGTTTTDAASAYSQCVQAAGGDLAKVQKCAPLLGQ